MPATKPTYRGELLPDLAKMNAEQIAARVRAASILDGGFQRGLKALEIGLPDNEEGRATRAVIESYRSLLDIGLASIAAAEHGTEVRLYTLNVVVPGAKSERRKTRRV